MEVKMLRKVSTVSIAGALIAGVLLASPASAAVSNGSTCPTLNKTTKVGGFTYKCVAAVKSTVTVDGDKTTIFIPVASLAVKNSKRYFVSSDCVAEALSYPKNVKDLATLETSTAKAITALDAQIALQIAAGATAQAQIDKLTSENAAKLLEINDQTAKIPETQAKIDSLNLTVANITKQIEDFTLILNDSKAQLVILKADTKNLTKNATVITKLTNAISTLSIGIANLKTKNSTIKGEVRSLTGSVSTVKGAILQFRIVINKNLKQIDELKTTSENVTALTKTRELTIANLAAVKPKIAEALTFRNQTCSAGL
jgi:hypothetical protein